MHDTAKEMDVYPVGLFWEVRTYGWRKGWAKSRRFVVLQAKAGNWRAVRNHFNGYLAEHGHAGHNAGRGWTRRAAIRRAARICANHTQTGRRD